MTEDSARTHHQTDDCHQTLQTPQKQHFRRFRIVFGPLVLQRENIYLDLKVDMDKQTGNRRLVHVRTRRNQRE